MSFPWKKLSRRKYIYTNFYQGLHYVFGFLVAVVAPVGYHTSKEGDTQVRKQNSLHLQPDRFQQRHTPTHTGLSENLGGLKILKNFEGGIRNCFYALDLSSVSWNKKNMLLTFGRPGKVKLKQPRPPFCSRWGRKVPQWFPQNFDKPDSVQALQKPENLGDINIGTPFWSYMFLTEAC